MNWKAAQKTRLSARPGAAKRSKAGLSEGVIAILLVIVGLVIAVAVFLFAGGFIGSAAVSPKAAIQQFDITVTPGGNVAAVTLVIKNTGNVRITDATPQWVGVGGPALTPEGGTTADPGRTIVLAATASPSPFVIGNQYIVRVTIEYANGAREVLTAQATAHP
jgi:uncharacterized protein (DUF58 family)